MELDEISNKIAKDCGLSELQVQQINRSQWRFLTETIQTGDMSSVSMIYLGKFFRNQKYDRNGDKFKRDI